MAGNVQTPEVAVVLACEGNVFVVVPQSLLMKECSVFSAGLSTTWQKSNTESGMCYRREYLVFRYKCNKLFRFKILGSSLS